jgi:3-phosphoinositide dependent protein kinase-1
LTEDDEPLVENQESANMMDEMRSGDIDNERRGTFVGTVNFIAPEMIQEQHSSCASDLWALGCIIFKMVTGKVPFPGMSEAQVFPAILSRKVEWPNDIDPCAKDLIDKLLQVIPYDRLGYPKSKNGMKALMRHPYFEGINFNTDLT